MSLSTPNNQPIFVQRGKEENYKKIVGKYYKDFKDSQKTVKNKILAKTDPITQQLDKYKPRPTKSNELVNHYNQKFADRDIPNSKKTFTKVNNLDKGLYVDLSEKDKILHKKPKPNEIPGAGLNNKERIDHVNYEHIKIFNKNDNVANIINQEKRDRPVPEIHVNRKKYIPANDTNDILLMRPKKQDRNYYLNRSQEFPENVYCRFDSSRDNRSTFNRIFNNDDKKKGFRRLNSNGQNSYREYFNKPKTRENYKDGYNQRCDSINDIFYNGSYSKNYDTKGKITMKPNEVTFNELSNQAKNVLMERYYEDE